MAVQPLIIEDFGDQLVATVTFQKNGANANPDTVRWIVRAPDGTETPYAEGDAEWAHPSTGVYQLYFLPATPATTAQDWQVRCEGISTDPDGVTQAAQGTVRIRGTPFLTASIDP
jgi:hypothetical protein